MQEKEKRELRNIKGMEEVSIPFADYVQITTSPRVGTILTFSQVRPRAEAEQSYVVSQVFLPLEIAAKTALLVLQQLHQVEQETGQKIIPETVHVEIKDKAPS